ncbi:hypothetical protein GLIP_0975 [Aliiglaciecola lipolytica E3]|uniref:Uncharacterized protein n=1 Tax=Aliiglaciecola lipolytica E3 TaxID=1127673 RepID=K6Y5U9_9ALTE|nr:hypothetical protein GLIP_0975 [Aliiglaciecola lipolytica E3]
MVRAKIYKFEGPGEILIIAAAIEKAINVSIDGMLGAPNI